MEKATEAFAKSKYSMVAVAQGFRDLRDEELIEVIEILRKSKVTEILGKLDILHKYHPSTVAFNKSQAKQCRSFDSQCDCYLPDTGENIYCIRMKRKRLEERQSRNYPEYIKWRKLVFERDDFTCQECKIKGGYLHAHHIKSFKKYPKLRLDINNGITFCIGHHMDAHYGEN